MGEGWRRKMWGEGGRGRNKRERRRKAVTKGEKGGGRFSHLHFDEICSIAELVFRDVPLTDNGGTCQETRPGSIPCRDKKPSKSPIIVVSLTEFDGTQNFRVQLHMYPTL